MPTLIYGPLLAFFVAGLMGNAPNLILAVLLVYGARLNGGRWFHHFLKSASVGYAIPGTMIGVGLMILVLRLDNAIDARTQAWFGFNWGPSPCGIWGLPW